MPAIELIKNLPSEAITLLVGTVGGLVGFLVSDGKSISLAVSAIIVGGFSAFMFPPIIIELVEHYSDIVIDDDIRTSITGSVAAVSWQLIVGMKTAIPALIQRFTKTKPKGEK